MAGRIKEVGNLRGDANCARLSGSKFARRRAGGLPG
jgi:hypothetical protein